MKDDNLDLEPVRRAVLSSLKPVRPLAPEWVWVAVLLGIFIVVALAGGTGLGFYGVQALDGCRLALILVLLLTGASIAAFAIAREMTPAGLRKVHPAALAALSVAMFAAAFVLLFRDYDMVAFGRGVACLRAGMLFALPAAGLGWIVARRGFVLDRLAAGVAIGMLGGLTGLAMLELHCPILTAPHVLVWHLAVLAFSAALGALAGWIGR